MVIISIIQFHGSKMKFGGNKMLKQLLFNSSLLFVTLSIYSCEDCCEMTDYESYLPLKLGNKWTYTNDVWEVVAMETINELEYWTILTGNGNGGNIYYRFDDSKLIQFYSTDSIEVLIADFSLNEGDSFTQVSTGYNVYVYSDNPDEFTFHYDYPGGADEEYSITFGVDKGILSICSLAWGGCTELIDYELK